jgi:hypothetical protein
MKAFQVASHFIAASFVLGAGAYPLPNLRAYPN